jgi:Kef-type K+ transport system membrane component KefB
MRYEDGQTTTAVAARSEARSGALLSVCALLFAGLLWMSLTLWDSSTTVALFLGIGIGWSAGMAIGCFVRSARLRRRS